MGKLLGRLEDIVLKVPRWIYRKVAVEAQREAATADRRRAAIRDTIEAVAEAMQHYEIARRGRAPRGEGATAAMAAAERARARAAEIDDDIVRTAVGRGRTAVVAADMEYRHGAEPPGRTELQAAADTLIDQLGALLRAVESPG